ncbi:amidase [Pseudohalioglobus sediminis]|nr:amidase [Pseudohalioglobus sediminis]
MSDDLCYASATELLAAFRRGELSPLEVLEAQIARRDAVNSEINALAFTFDEEALAAARKAEQAYTQGTARALEGLTCAIKDETYIAGQVTTNGSLLLRDAVATTTDPVPERLLAAGAIVHQRTCTPEFSVASYTWSRLWGVTRNPWNREYTPGGSTGGGAASLAAGMTTLSNGTDIGGSIRIPASQCGLVGFKASYGRVPEIFPYNIDPYCHHGVLARNVPDLALAYDCVAGPHLCDIASQLPRESAVEPVQDLCGVTLGYSLDLGFYELDACVRSNTLDTLARLADAGATLIEVDIQLGDWVIEMARTHQGFLMGTMLRQNYGAPEQAEQLCDYTRWHLEHTGDVTPEQVRWANERANHIWAQLGPVLAKVDGFICPTVASPEIAADFDYSRDQCVISGKPVDANKGWFLTYPFNAVGRCPVLSMPTGFSARGVPTGMQLVGSPYRDRQLMALAAACERALPRWFGVDRRPALG